MFEPMVTYTVNVIKNVTVVFHFLLQPLLAWRRDKADV